MKYHLATYPALTFWKDLFSTHRWLPPAYLRFPSPSLLSFPLTWLFCMWSSLLAT